MAKASQDKENVAQQASKLTSNVATTNANIETMKQQIARLDSAMSSIRADAATADKRAEYSLSLYNKITNITWDYDNVAPNTLSGCT